MGGEAKDKKPDVTPFECPECGCKEIEFIEHIGWVGSINKETGVLELKPSLGIDEGLREPRCNDCQSEIHGVMKDVSDGVYELNFLN